MLLQLIVLLLAGLSAFAIAKIGVYPQNGKLGFVANLLLGCLLVNVLIAIWAVSDLRYFKRIKDYVPPKNLSQYKKGQIVTLEGVVSHDNFADEFYAVRYAFDKKFDPNPVLVNLENATIKVWKEGNLEVSNWKEEADGYYLERGDYVVIEAVVEDPTTVNARAIVRGNYLRFVQHEIQYIWFSYFILILSTITSTYTAFHYLRAKTMLSQSQ